jgi:hypothetical protein
MNYTMGRYIDEATDEMRDRLVTAADLNDGLEWHSDNGCGCLVGTALNGHPLDVGRDEWVRHMRVEFDEAWKHLPASTRYPHAVRRFGKARVVRAIKKRAGARVEIPTETPTPAEVAP